MLTAAPHLAHSGHAEDSQAVSAPVNSAASRQNSKMAVGVVVLLLVVDDESTTGSSRAWRLPCHAGSW